MHASNGCTRVGPEAPTGRLGPFIAGPRMDGMGAMREDDPTKKEREMADQTVEVFVARLRRKLGASIIETQRGLGYRMATR